MLKSNTTIIKRYRKIKAIKLRPKSRTNKMINLMRLNPSKILMLPQLKLFRDFGSYTPTLTFLLSTR
jgi:hypothetical protein